MFEKNNRIIYLDKLRIISMVFVVVIHVFSYGKRINNFLSEEWIIFEIIECLSRFCVPVFVGISGALFLKQDITIKTIFKKYLLRIIISLFFWNTFYAVVEGNTGTQLIKKIIQGHYHLWFLYVIILLYLLTPLLRKIASEKKLLIYHILSLLIVQYIVPIFKIVSVFDIFNSQIIIFIRSILGYILYYLLGYYFYLVDFKKSTRTIFYLFGLAGFALTPYLTITKTIANDFLIDKYINYLSFTVMFQFLGVYVFGKEYLNQLYNKSERKIVLLLSKCSYGIYLVHPFVADKLFDLFIILKIKNNYLFFLTMFFLTLIISLIISLILNKIKIINKYLV